MGILEDKRTDEVGVLPHYWLSSRLAVDCNARRQDVRFGHHAGPEVV